MPYPYSNDPYDRHDHYSGYDDYDNCHCHAGKRRDCDILTPLASGTIRTRGDWVCVDLPRHIAHGRPLTLTRVTAEGVDCVALDPSCDPCRSEYGLAVRVTIPLSLTLLDCHGYQHAVCSSIDVCVPITQCSCSRIPKNAQVRVKACVSLAEQVCVKECERIVEALLNMRIDVYIIGKLPVCEPCEICPLPLPWYPEPAKLCEDGEWRYD